MAKVSLRAYNREIETMIDRGQLDEAIAHCRHILKTYPKHLETYRLLGKAYLEYKRHGDAADIFSRILVSVPNDFVAQVGMSIIRDEENRLDDAIWHMERAFETQPSNPAIQAELQRLYARRDGVRPPRIRMTRGALAQMYVQGELYPQAISEIKSVLQEDPARADMQALLAKACFKSGLRNEAAEVATALLRRYSYSLDANRVLVEILGSDHPESTQLYRQRVYELDPYAAHVTGNVFQSTEVSDAAVNIERLDWNGQPVAMQPDWSESRAISLEGEAQAEEQPDWLNRPLEDAPRLDASTLGPSQPTPAPIFDSTAPFESSPAQPADDIPDFLREAGWGKSTGAFDESGSAFTNQEPEATLPIEQGDLPDWVKAMKPTEAETPAQEEQEDLPDWIANLGTGALSSQAGGQADWMSQPEQTSGAPGSDSGEQADWLNQLEGKTESTPAGDLNDELDWLKNLGEKEAAPAADSTEDDLDWLKNIGRTESIPAEAETDDLDWIKNLGETDSVTPEMSSDFPDWMQQSDATPATARQDQAEWLKGLEEPQSASPSSEADQPEWLKGLSTEPESAGLPEKEEKPDWLSQIGEETEPSPAAPSTTDFDFLDQLSEEPILSTPQESKAESVDLEHLGVSEQERDDSFAWLESLAAKQGATEGLLTKPEDRLEEEPEWVKQAKGLKSEPSVSEPPVEQQPVSVEDLGKTEQEQDDSFAWLENLAARQGATEGLLTKPEERLEDEPEWVKRAKDLSAQETPASLMPEPELEQLAAMAEPEPEVEQPALDDTAAWLKSLEEGEKFSQPETTAVEPVWEQPAAMQETQPVTEQTGTDDEIETWLKTLEGDEQPAEPAAAADETAMWLKNLDERESTPVPPAEQAESDLPAWMKDIEEETPAAAPALSSSETELQETWMPPAEETVQPASMTESASEADALPSWLSELDKEEEQIATSADDDDLPAWLRTEEPAPSAAEPTLASDWKPAEEAYEEPAAEQPVTFQAQQATLPEVPFEEAGEITFVEEEQLVQEEPESAPVMETQVSTAGSEREPATSMETGELRIPTVDPVLGAAREELSRNNVEGALESYGRLIKKARYLDEVIFDLRDALYRHPVDVSLWQSLGDAYMRANRLQDALDAYTKAEELIR